MDKKIAAIYARQSLDKKDSVSIDAQIEKCVALCTFKGKDYKVYHDKGYSGKNINRPDYSEIVNDIKAGIIDEVIVYKVDRISRNLNDFSNMISDFESYGVSFTSATESFDTSSPMGRAMMYLLMVFAQLERETIAERIKDNAMYRAGLGRWTGGVVPIGYDKTKVFEDNKQKSRLLINQDEAAVVRQLFDWYLEPECSVRGVVFKANRQGIKTKEGSEWGNSSVSRLLQNPLYASNSISVYDYFTEKDLGVTIYNDPEEFDGKHAMMYYRKRGEDVKRRKGLKTQEQYIIIGEHEPIVHGDVWVKAQYKLEKNKMTAFRKMNSTATFLTGMVKCGICGSLMSVFWSESKVQRHYYLKCRRQQMKGKFLCDNKSVRIDELEKVVTEYLMKICNDKTFIRKMIADARKFEKKVITPINNQKSEIAKKIAEKKINIESLIENLGSMQGEVTSRLIEKKIEEINQDINMLNAELRRINEKEQLINISKDNKQFLIDNYKSIANNFLSAPLEEKQVLIRTVIKVIVATKGNISINIFE